MKRALLVSVGTVAGLSTVLSYSDGSGDLLDAAAAMPASPEAPTTEPTAPETISPPPTTASPTAEPSSTEPTTESPSASASESQSRSASPTPSRTPTTATPRTTPTPTRTATPKPTPKPTRTSSPKPTPTPTPTGGDGEYVGVAASHRYGTVQVAITVTDGVITGARAVRYPTGESQRYSDLSIPTLVAETIGATTAEIAAVSGATLTSYAWMGSLESAMSKAGI